MINFARPARSRQVAVSSEVSPQRIALTDRQVNRVLTAARMVVDKSKLEDEFALGGFRRALQARSIPLGALQMCIDAVADDRGVELQSYRIYDYRQDNIGPLMVRVIWRDDELIQSPLTSFTPPGMSGRRVEDLYPPISFGY